jgi:hypothetical protein
MVHLVEVAQQEQQILVAVAVVLVQARTVVTVVQA